MPAVSLARYAVTLVFKLNSDRNQYVFVNQ